MSASRLSPGGSARALRRLSTADVGLVRDFSKTAVADSHDMAEYDIDGDQRLDFEEWLAMQPRQLKERLGTDQMRAMFDAVDSDGGGSVSINEHFLWSLSKAKDRHGKKALRLFFQRYSTRGSPNRLDAIEFGNACIDLGLGVAANELFRMLDADGSGEISYDELASAVARTSAAVSAHTRADLSTLIVPAVDGRQSSKLAMPKLLDTSRWRIRARDAQGVAAELRTLLRESGGHTVDILHLFVDVSHGKHAASAGAKVAKADGPLHLHIDEGQFRTCMRER